MEDLTEEGIKAALRKLTEDTRRIRLELLDQMRRPYAVPEDADDRERSKQYEIRGSGPVNPKNR